MRALSRCLFLSFASLLFPLALHGQDSSSYMPGERNWKQVCAQAVTVPLPPEVAAPKTKTASNCDATALYYGFHGAPDYSAALACAARGRAGGKVSLLDSTGILAEIYANGSGVPRNLPLAMRFSCELSNTSALFETTTRVQHIEDMESGKLPASTHFDLCDDATSGMMGGWCEAKDEDIADFARDKRVAAIRSKLSPAAQAMLPALQAAERRFEEARSGYPNGEYMGGGGSGSAGFAIGDQNLLREQFVRNLESFASDKTPHATTAARADARRQLDASERDALSRQPVAGQSTQEGVVATQQAWQQLFDAWMRFVPVAFPHLPPDDAATELLRLRIHQLKHV